MEWLEAQLPKKKKSACPGVGNFCFCADLDASMNLEASYTFDEPPADNSIAVDTFDVEELPSPTKLSIGLSRGSKSPTSSTARSQPSAPTRGLAPPPLLMGTPAVLSPRGLNRSRLSSTSFASVSLPSGAPPMPVLGNTRRSLGCTSPMSSTRQHNNLMSTHRSMSPSLASSVRSLTGVAVAHRQILPGPLPPRPPAGTQTWRRLNAPSLQASTLSASVLDCSLNQSCGSLHSYQAMSRHGSVKSMQGVVARVAAPAAPAHSGAVLAHRPLSPTRVSVVKQGMATVASPSQSLLSTRSSVGVSVEVPAAMPGMRYSARRACSPTTMALPSEPVQRQPHAPFKTWAPPLLDSSRSSMSTHRANSYAPPSRENTSATTTSAGDVDASICSEIPRQLVARPAASWAPPLMGSPLPMLLGQRSPQTLPLAQVFSEPIATTGAKPLKAEKQNNADKENQAQVGHQFVSLF